jgi:hypothetical protein
MVRCSENWTLVKAEHIRSRARNPLDSKFQLSGDVEVVQQIPQPAGGDQGFISGGLDLIGVTEHLVLLGVAQGSVVFIIFALSLVAHFFFFLIVFFLPMIIIVVVVLQKLLSFLCAFSCRYHDHNLEGVLPLRNVLRGVRLRLWRRWYILGTNYPVG